MYIWNRLANILNSFTSVSLSKDIKYLANLKDDVVYCLNKLSKYAKGRRFNDKSYD